MSQEPLKTYLVSVTATMFGEGISVEHSTENAFVCNVRTDARQVVIGIGQLPLLLVQFEEEEAREDALNQARKQFPEAEGWTNHKALLMEIPRSMFVRMQLFISAREVYSHALRLVGFSRD